MTIQSSDIHRILVIKLRAIGDVLLSTVVVRNLRAAWPDARIDFLTEKPSREVLEGNSEISDVLSFDKHHQHGASLVMDVRRRRYDLVIDLFGNPRSALVTLFSGARYRVGYRFGWRSRCYNIVVEPRGGEAHNTDFNLDALRAIDVPVVDSIPVFPMAQDAVDFAEQFFRDSQLQHSPVVALNPGGGWYTKRWGPSHFATLGNMLIQRFNVKIIVVWGPGEQALAEEIKQGMSSNAVLIPPTSLKQLAAILRRCVAVVTNDSGPMHIAAAMGTPIVAVFGPTNPELQGPVSSEHEIARNERLICLGCNYTKCPIGNPCMEELSAEDVFVVFSKLVVKNDIFREHLSTV